MNRQKWILLVVALVLVGAATAFLQHWRLHQKLGAPGIRATPIDGSLLMQIQLPEQVLDYTSEVVEATAVVTNMLPKDTSLASRVYKKADGFQISLNTVMMGKDRTSIHKPEYCLPGQGWKIEKREEMKLPMTGPPAYELPAMKWTLSLAYQDKNGNTVDVRGFYVFWFTAKDKLTGSHGQRLWWMMRDLLRTGVLERWAYVSYFCWFPPAAEAEAAERMERFVAASAPEIQIPPQTGGTMAGAR